MKKTGYILFALWLCTVVLSNALITCKSFYDNSSLELTEKESKDKSSDSDDDSDDETEKKSESKSEKEFFTYKNLNIASAKLMAELSLQPQIPAHDEDFVSSLYVILPENPPEL
jgi:hypothetical protein